MSDTEVVNAPAPEAALSAEDKAKVVAEFFKEKTPSLPVVEPKAAKDDQANAENPLAQAADGEVPAIGRQPGNMILGGEIERHRGLLGAGGGVEE